MKTASILISAVLAATLLLCSCSAASYHGDLRLCTDDFEAINDKLLSLETQKEKTLFSVITQKGKNTEIYHFPVELNERQLNSLNQLADAFSTDFSFIEITEARITYGGDGGDMFVYSIDGSTPNYFYYAGDNVRFSVESLGNNWYFCHARLR